MSKSFEMDIELKRLQHTSLSVMVSNILIGFTEDGNANRSQTINMKNISVQVETDIQF